VHHLQMYDNLEAGVITYHKARRKVHLADLRRASQEHRGSTAFSTKHAYIMELIHKRKGDAVGGVGMFSSVDDGDGDGVGVGVGMGGVEREKASLVPTGQSMLNTRIMEDDDEIACEADAELMDESIEDSGMHMENTAGAGAGKYAEGLMVAYSTQDVRVYTNSGRVIARMEPEYIVDGIKSIAISVYQQLLFCLCEKDKLRVFSLREMHMPCVKEVQVQGQGDKFGEEMGTCLEMLDVLPNNTSRSGANSKFRRRTDVEGNRVPHYLGELDYHCTVYSVSYIICE
jgi:hypothetical protein